MLKIFSQLLALVKQDSRYFRICSLGFSFQTKPKKPHQLTRFPKCLNKSKYRKGFLYPKSPHAHYICCSINTLKKSVEFSFWHQVHFLIYFFIQLEIWNKKEEIKYFTLKSHQVLRIEIPQLRNFIFRWLIIDFSDIELFKFKILIKLYI